MGNVAAKEKLDQFKEKNQKEYDKVKVLVDDWAQFSLNPQSEEDIRERIINDKQRGTNTVCISYICANSVLSEEFIEELCELTKAKETNRKTFVNKVDWLEISEHQKLSEEFIARHAKEVVWPVIFMNQDLSDEFKEKYAIKLAQIDYENILKGIKNN